MLRPATLKLRFCPSLPVPTGQSGLPEGEHTGSELCSHLKVLSGLYISGDLFNATEDAHLASAYN